MFVSENSRSKWARVCYTPEETGEMLVRYSDLRMRMTTPTQLAKTFSDTCGQNNINLVETLLRENTTNDPEMYHNNEHMISVAIISYWLMVENFTKPKLPLLIASLFHDFGHTLGKKNDRANIDIALRSVQKLFGEKIDREELDESCRLIYITEYPFQKHNDPETLEQACLRDADILYAMTYDIQQRLRILRRLNLELTGNPNVQDLELLALQAKFWRSVKMFTTQGQKILEAMLYHFEDSYSDIENFIGLIANSFGGAKHVYTNGSCYKFAQILKTVFPAGHIKDLRHHIVFEYGIYTYDITGRLGFKQDLNAVELEARSTEFYLQQHARFDCRLDAEDFTDHNFDREIVLEVISTLFARNNQTNVDTATKLLLIQDEFARWNRSQTCPVRVMMYMDGEKLQINLGQHDLLLTALLNDTNTISVYLLHKELT